MAQMAATDVTYTAIVGTHEGSPSVPMKSQMFTVLMPAAGATNVLYTNGGIPLTIGKLGCPANLMKFLIEDMASSVGVVPKFDYGATTIRLYLTQNTTGASTTTSLIEMATSATVPSITLRCIAQGW